MAQLQFHRDEQPESLSHLRSRRKRRKGRRKVLLDRRSKFKMDQVQMDQNELERVKTKDGMHNE